MKSRILLRLLVALTGSALPSVGCVKKFSPAIENTNLSNSEASQPDPSVLSLISHYEFYADGGRHFDNQIYRRLGSSVIDPITNNRVNITEIAQGPTYSGDVISISPHPNQDRLLLVTTTGFYVQDFDINTGKLLGSPKGVELPEEPTSMAITPDGRIAFVSTVNQKVFSLTIDLNGKAANLTPPIQIQFTIDRIAALGGINQHLLVVKGVCNSDLRNATGLVSSQFATYRANPDSGDFGPLLSKAIVSYSAVKFYSPYDDDNGLLINYPGTATCRENDKAQLLLAIPNTNQIVWTSFVEPQVQKIQINANTGEIGESLSLPNKIGVEPILNGRFPTLFTFLPSTFKKDSLALMQVDGAESTSVWGVAAMPPMAIPVGAPYPSIDGSQVYIPYRLSGIDPINTDRSTSVMTFQVDPERKILLPRSDDHHEIGGAISAVAFLEVAKDSNALSVASGFPSPVRRLAQAPDLGRSLLKQLSTSRIASQSSSPTRKFSDYQTSDVYSCAVTEGERELFCRNAQGEQGGPINFGNGNPEFLKEFTRIGLLRDIRSISISDTHYCVVKDGQDPKASPLILCQGQNVFGNLGVTHSQRDGLYYSWFPIEAIDLESELDPDLIVNPVARVTDYQTCISSPKGPICMGAPNNRFSRAVIQQPISTQDIAFGIDSNGVISTESICVLDNDNLVQCWQNQAVANVPPSIHKLPFKQVTQIVGKTGFCAITEGSVKCWANHEALSIQDIPLTEKAIRLEVVGGRFFSILESGEVMAWHIFWSDHRHFTTPVRLPQLKGSKRIGLEFRDGANKLCGLIDGSIICSPVPAGFFD